MDEYESGGDEDEISDERDEYSEEEYENSDGIYDGYEEKYGDVLIYYIPPGQFDVENVAADQGFVITRNSTVNDLRAYMEQDHQARIPADEQILVYLDSVILLDDFKRLNEIAADCGLDEFHEVHVYHKINSQQVKIRVHIDPALIDPYSELPNPHQVFNVSSQSLVSDLKRRIDAAIGLSPHRQRLENQMHPETDMSDNLSLDAFITDQNGLDITLTENPRNPELTMNITLELADGQLVNFPMEVYDTIGCLRGIIRRNGFLQLPRRDFRLYKHGENDQQLYWDMNLHELGITRETTVYVEEDVGDILDD